MRKRFPGITTRIPSICASRPSVSFTSSTNAGNPQHLIRRFATTVHQSYSCANVRALPEPVVGDNKSLIVNNNLSLEASLTAVPVFSLPDAVIFLLERFDFQIGEANPRSGHHTTAFSQREIQAPNRQRVCRRTPLQIHIDAAVESYQAASILIPETVFARQLKSPITLRVANIDVGTSGVPSAIADNLISNFGRPAFSNTDDCSAQYPMVDIL